MKRLILKPSDFEMSFDDCPPGLFLCGKNVCLKSEYSTETKSDAYCDSGEYFCSIHEKVIPLEAIWEDC